MQNHPEVIGKYKILSVVAVGGMGTVYKAVHPSLKRQVIIKRLSIKNRNGAIRERFKREAQILLDLSSPYVVRMFDYFTEGRSDYIVLEFVDGLSLDKLIEKQVSLPPELALLIFLDACYGLKHAHAKGIVHRDIKPGNILISRRAEVKLADFGIASGEKENEVASLNARQMPQELQTVTVSENITQAGTTLGTPAYMSPEQLDDSSSVDQRADIYSMGVMLYEMLTGSKPYAGDMAPETIAKIKKGDYIPPERLDKRIPPVARRIVKKMMKPDPAKRYSSIDPVIKKIRNYLKRYDTHFIRVTLAQTVIAKDTFELPPYEPKKHPGIKAMLIIILAAFISFSCVYGWKHGFFHKTVLSPWFTQVTLNIEMPSTASADADLPARAFFFENDNDKIPEVKGSRRIFYCTETNTSQKRNINYRTKPVYLRPGDYRIKVVEGPYVWWKSVTVEKENMELNLQFLRNAKRQLVLHAQAFDSQTGEDISSKTTFKILQGSKWVNLKNVDTSALKTGTVYRFLSVADGYENEYFSLRLDWYQDELFINSSLKKKSE